MKKIILIFMALSSILIAEEVIETSKLVDNVDLSNYKEIEKQNNKIIVNSSLSNVDGIYNYTYSPTSKSKIEETNILLIGNFDKIHRYPSIYFKDNSLFDSSKQTLKEIIKKVHKYIDDDSREIIISVLGFTQKIKNKNEEVSLNTKYTNFFQNIVQRDNLNPKSASEDALNYIDIVYKKLLDDNISSDIIYKENRVGKDNLYTEEFSDGRAQNNRVDIAIYVKKIFDPDTDADGVHDSKDYCPETPIGASVDEHGCPLIMSLDLKFDFDKATISDEKSLQDIKKLSKFMQKYNVYHANIVGHTDATGNSKYNQELSIRRAKVVKNMIAEDGVESSRLSYEGRGESEPLFENINPLNRHKNRRTEVELTLPKKKVDRAKPKLRSRKSRE